MHEDKIQVMDTFSRIVHKVIRIILKIILQQSISSSNSNNHTPEIERFNNQETIIISMIVFFFSPAGLLSILLFVAVYNHTEQKAKENCNNNIHIYFFTCRNLKKFKGCRVTYGKKHLTR